MSNGPRGWRHAAPWLLLSAAAAVVLATRLQLSFDLSAFFPRHAELEHEILLEQFRNGPGSRLMVIGIRGDSRADLPEVSNYLKEVLQDDARFTHVLNGQVSDELAALPTPVESHYLLLGDIDYSEESLRAVVEQRLRDLAFGGGEAVVKIISRDPFLVSLDVLQGLSAGELSDELWFADDGAAVLLAETRATAVDIGAQADAIAAIRTAYANIPAAGNTALDITGVGAFSVELQETIRSEATRRSILAALALLTVLIVFLRKPRYLLLAALPISIGYLVGMAVVTLLFGTLHGITLAFGFTLMGVAIDYPLHLINHHIAAADNDAGRRIWPTLRLGALSTAVAYLALALSGSDGLAQLGVFSACGILVAVLVTHTWLPNLLDRRGAAATSATAGANNGPALRVAPALVALCAFVAIAFISVPAGGLWNDQLSSLSPVPAARLAADKQLRAATGAVDMRFQLALHAAGLDDVLRRTGDIDNRLADAAAAGHLEAWQAVTTILPDKDTQRARQRRIPESAELRERMDKVLAATPFRDSAFDPFIEQAAASRDLPLLELDDLRQSSLASWLDAHLFRVRDKWVSLVSLNSPDPVALAEHVRDWGAKVTLVDLQEASVDLMRDYRHSVFTTVSFAALGIVLLIGYRRRRFFDVIWIGLTVAAALVGTMLFVNALHGQLTVIHLIALLLVMGLGLDYTLFLSRTELPPARAASGRAVLVCAVSTALAFSILAGSSIPVLKYLGLTVAAGSTISYLLATIGSRPLPALTR